jgi:Tfp pilus assembly protein PilO
MKRSTLTRLWLGLRLSAILVVTFACLYQFILANIAVSADLDRSIAEIASEVDTQLHVLKSARRLLEIEENDHKEWEASVLDSIPREPQVNEILDLLSRQAQDAGLRLLNSYAEHEEPIEEERKGQKIHYIRIPVLVEVVGSWPDLAAYLDRIREIPRKTRFSSLEVSRKDEFFPNCHGEIRLDVFYLVEESPGTASPQKRKR